MTDTTIKLIGHKGAQDQDGVWRDGKGCARQIFARVDSVTRAEFFDAGQRGLNPEYKFTVFHAEYQGEDECEYAGARYAIYRTFRVPQTDDLEIYVERKAGVNGGQSHCAG